jgi:SAM-dependent methyltransferase
MAVKDWRKEKLIRAWLDHSGPFGDLYRQLLINPIVHGLLSSAHTHLSASPLTAALDDWLLHYAKSLGTGPKPTVDWYALWRQHRSRGQAPLQILDLGCGEAYRGRWLACKGVYYKGVDGSSKLLEQSSSQAMGFETHCEDLDSEDALDRSWPDNRPPPDWVFLVTVLDHLEHPQRLLNDLAQRYSAGDGKLLVITCNPRFYGQAPSRGEPAIARIASLPPKDGSVDVYFRSRTAMRRMFRDAGFNILDELSPCVPAAVERFFPDPGEDHYNPSVAPFHFWLLQASSTQRMPATRDEVQAWFEQLPGRGAPVAATRLLLRSLLDKGLVEGSVYWRHVAAGATLLQALNPGGRLFVVREGHFSLQSNPEEPDRLAFGPNDTFGEIETYAVGKERERVYSMTVRESGRDRWPAKVLEIPSVVVQQLMEDPLCLGNPFLTALRQKVMQALLKRPSQSWEPANTFHNMFGRGLPQVPKRAIVKAAELLVAALEADRERIRYDFETRRTVYLDDAVGAVTRLFDRQVKAPDLNAAFEFLHDAGVIRLLRTSHLPKLEKAMQAVWPEGRGPARGDTTPILRRAFQALETECNMADFVEYLDADKQAAYRQFAATRKYEIFLIEDVTMLMRCAMIPSKSVFTCLEQRYEAFHARSDLAMVRRFRDMCRVSLRFWRQRLESGSWHLDSLGFPLPTGVGRSSVVADER